MRQKPNEQKKKQRSKQLNSMKKKSNNNNTIPTTPSHNLKLETKQTKKKHKTPKTNRIEWQKKNLDHK